ncbi:Hypothetical predicted protein [Mytilus galloprovincialis]|uniref:RRM domain-containing protein n=1 Tax=Mytilus galloprovincialis TaxID=29158 RepID=A0A8B6BM18_MYTGA|nr:Hypothetical predicted protein [Mytilus galloprovincialis]
MAPTVLNQAKVTAVVHAEKPVSNFNTSSYEQVKKNTTKRAGKRRISSDLKQTSPKKPRSDSVPIDAISSETPCIGVNISSNVTNDTDDLRAMISNLTESMNVFHNQLSIRIDGLENNITQKIERIIDKRIETAMRKERGNTQKDLDKMEKKMESTISKCKTDLKQDLHSVKKELSDFKKSYAETASQAPILVSREDRQNNVIIRNLPESKNENLLNKVGGLLKDGLKLKDISVKSADRKTSNNDSRPGVIIVSFEISDDRRKVMAAKRMLKDSRNYKNVFIDFDIPKAQRVLNANLRNIVRTIGQDKLEIRGSRIQVKHYEGQASGMRNFDNREKRNNFNRIDQGEYENNSRNRHQYNVPSDFQQRSGSESRRNIYPDSRRRIKQH